MKYLALIAILLPLVYGAAVPRTQDDIDLIPDMSTAEDGKIVILVPDMSVASDADNSAARAPEEPFVAVDAAEDKPEEIVKPDMSVAADASDDQVAPVRADADLIPDMSVAEDAKDKVKANADLVPDMSVASDAE